MNGISVMACVQSAQPVVRSSFGKDSRVQQKYIVISSQKTGRRQAGVSAFTCPAEKSAGTAPETSSKVSGSRCGHKDSRGRSAERQARRGAKDSGICRSAFVLRAIVLAMVFSGMLAGFQMMTRASNREKEHKYKYYTTVTVAYGQDLTDIVFQYCDSSEYDNADAYLQEICEINSLPYSRDSVPELRPGTRIVIPYYSAELK